MSFKNVCTLHMSCSFFTLPMCLICVTGLLFTSQNKKNPVLLAAVPRCLLSLLGAICKVPDAVSALFLCTVSPLHLQSWCISTMKALTKRHHWHGLLTSCLDLNSLDIWSILTLICFDRFLWTLGNDGLRRIILAYFGRRVRVSYDPWEMIPSTFWDAWHKNDLLYKNLPKKQTFCRASKEN